MMAGMQTNFRDRVSISTDTDAGAHVAHVKMTRADKHNGLDLAMFQALSEAGQEVRKNPSIRAVVLSGEGPSFCAGLDLKSVMGGGTDARALLLERPSDTLANLAQRCAWVWQEVDVPVIAAVHGAAYGGGCQIALACDLRLVAPDTRLSVMEIKWGLIPDMSITQTLLKLVRPDVAKALTWTGRKVGAVEALSLGLVTEICDDPLAAALSMAKGIATKNPHAVRHVKRLFNEVADLNAADALLLETELQLEVLGSKNQMEAVAANFQKRAPKFADPESEIAVAG